MNANRREYSVTVDEYTSAFLQRIEHARFREFPCTSVVDPGLLATEVNGNTPKGKKVEILVQACISIAVGSVYRRSQESERFLFALFAFFCGQVDKV